LIEEVEEWNSIGHTVLSLSIDLQIGRRVATLKALEAKTIIDVARVNKDRRRDGGNESKQMVRYLSETKLTCTLVNSRQMINCSTCSSK